MKGGSECTKRVENRALYVYRTGYDLRVATQVKSAKPTHFLRGDNSFPTRNRRCVWSCAEIALPSWSSRANGPNLPASNTLQLQPTKKTGEIGIFCSSFRTSFAQVPIKTETKLASMPRTTSPVFLENVSHPRVFHELRWFTEVRFSSQAASRSDGHLRIFLRIAS